MQVFSLPQTICINLAVDAGFGKHTSIASTQNVIKQNKVPSRMPRVDGELLI